MIFLLELPPDEWDLQEGDGSNLKAAGPAAKDLEAGGDDSSDYGDFWSAAAATKVIPVLELGDEESFDEIPPWMDNSFAEPTQSMLQQIRGLGGPSASSMGAPPVAGMKTLHLPQDGNEDGAASDVGAPGSSRGGVNASQLQPPAPEAAGGPGVWEQLQRTKAPAQGDANASSSPGASGVSKGQRQLSWQRSGSSSGPSSTPPETQHSGPLLARQLRPPRLTQDQMLRLMAEAYGQMVLSPADHAAVELTDAQLEVWLRQLLRLTRSKRDTVLALHGALKRQHPWMKLGDVYSALVYLRDELLRRGGGEGARHGGEPGEGARQGGEPRPELAGGA